MSLITMNKIVINWSEGSFATDRTFSKWSQVNGFLFSLACRNKGGYFKTGFTVYWDNGDTYEGKIEISATEYRLQDHMISHLKFHAGIWHPYHMTDQQYQGYLDTYKVKTAEFLAYLQTHYFHDTPSLYRDNDYYWWLDSDYPPFDTQSA